MATFLQELGIIDGGAAPFRLTLQCFCSFAHDALNFERLHARIQQHMHAMTHKTECHRESHTVRENYTVCPLDLCPPPRPCFFVLAIANSTQHEQPQVRNNSF